MNTIKPGTAARMGIRRPASPELSPLEAWLHPLGLEFAEWQRSVAAHVLKLALLHTEPPLTARR